MQIRRKLNSDIWTLKIVSEREMKRISGDRETAGLCLAYDKTIYIREDSVEYAIIAHEVYHGFFSYLYLSDTNGISLDDAEEIAASHFAAQGEVMVKKSKQFTRELQKLQERMNNE